MNRRRKKELARFMASPTGRGLRIAFGAGLLLAGLGAKRPRRRRLLIAAGIVPIAAGAFDVCLLAPLLGIPLRGADARRRLWW